MSPDAYCREVEAYLCRKNDGHLIRIVGPAFEQVSAWARDGIPLKVALAGVDRYFERYYRKGPRRRPVRIEFCEADIRDAFDDWRRAVGVTPQRVGDSGNENDLADQENAKPRRGSLASHVERAIARLTALRASSQRLSALTDVLDRLTRELDALQPDARRARGEARDVIVTRLSALDRQLTERALAALSTEDHARIAADADGELAPFRARMSAEAVTQSREAAIHRLIREELGLPRIAYD